LPMEPDWGGCSAARRPVYAVNVFFLRRSVFVKRFTHEMPLREVAAVGCGHSRPDIRYGRQTAAEMASAVAQLAIFIRWMVASRENLSRAVVAAGICCRAGAGVRACGVAGWMRLPVTPAVYGTRTRQLAWRWGLDLRVAFCCFERAGQYSGPGARRPGPPGSPLLSITPSIGGSGEQTAGNRGPGTRAGP